jgi:steroid Delta-isomerase
VTLLSDHVERFNDGVRSGDWSGMLELFAEDAELTFSGIPVGPFQGREAIAQAYREQPPDDEIVLLENRDGFGVYAWAREPLARAGELRLAERDGRILRLHVQYER